ncbi:GPW/gp25 family protein [Roseibium alexandrii]|uniref:GPW/gp25 family protein n=1 Tax=Roseibium alexandrii TaxID=388408 RepID=UPI0037538785
MAGVNAVTGKPLTGFEEVQQSIEKLVTTPQAVRIMREWVGNPGLKLLGENMTRRNILLWYNIIWLLIEVFEPRFRITRFEVTSAERSGELGVRMLGLYRPYAHLDWQQAALFISVEDGVVRLRAA